MKFSRKQSIEASFYPGRVLIIYGPRRVGKTTLLKHYLETQTTCQVLLVTGDDMNTRSVFASQSLNKLKRFASSYEIVAIDEAQMVSYIGLGTKMLIDTFPEKQFLLTGSSSFELGNQIGEPLTGRHFTLTLLPLAQQEITLGIYELANSLPDFLLYGSYPEVLSAPDTKTKERLLVELISSYLYKDVLALDRIKSPKLLHDITKMLALQIGSEVSLNEIANALNSDVKTVGRYLDLLEKMFVIKKVYGFSRNLRNEISKKARYYFLDNGIRNAVIGQFTPLDSRSDVGALWENFIFMELLKKDNLCETASTFYFWRTHTGQEIDIIREHNGALQAFECKWGVRKKVAMPKTFADAYPGTPFHVIHPENYLNYVLDVPNA